MAGRETIQRTVGVRGEDIAASFLEKKQHKILERNYRTKRGEIDIISQKYDEATGENVLVFVEVKARRGLQFGRALEAMTTEKMERVRRAAEFYMTHHGLEDTYCQFDVIGILMTPHDVHIEHMQDVVDY